jgi:hypothetical protein
LISTSTVREGCARIWVDHNLSNRFFLKKRPQKSAYVFAQPQTRTCLLFANQNHQRLILAPVTTREQQTVGNYNLPNYQVCIKMPHATQTRAVRRYVALHRTNRQRPRWWHAVDGVRRGQVPFDGARAHFVYTPILFYILYLLFL